MQQNSCIANYARNIIIMKNTNLSNVEIYLKRKDYICVSSLVS